MDVEPAGERPGGGSGRDPVCGVSLDSYAALTDEMARLGVVGPAAIDKFIEERGLDVESWSIVVRRWTARIAHGGGADGPAEPTS